MYRRLATTQVYVLYFPSRFNLDADNAAIEVLMSRERLASAVNVACNAARSAARLPAIAGEVRRARHRPARRLRDPSGAAARFLWHALEIAARFGGADKLHQAVDHLGDLLYAA
jgi:hypothetical protein